MELNKEQKLAVNHMEGACAVIASAGSGKSEVITRRIVNLVQKHNIKEPNILVLSFTAAAKSNLISRLDKHDINNVQIHTFHSLCKYILEQENCITNLYDDKNDKYAVTQLFRNISKFTNAQINNIFSFIQYQKKYGISYDGVFVDCEIMIPESDMRKCFKAYEDYKNKNNLTDFEDWISMSINILKTNKKYTYQYIMADEHQDTSYIQNQLIQLLCPSNNVFVVFDFKQSIYGFAGANPKYCMNFDKEYKNAKIINLDTNYRSCSNIIHNANNFIRKYYGDYEHYSDAISHSQDNGNIECITSFTKPDEANAILQKIQELINNGENPEDICILYRLNSHSDRIVKLFKENGIKYNIKNDGSFFKRKEVDVIISILRLIENTNDDEAFEKLYSYRVKNLHALSKKDLEKIKTKAGRYNLSLFQALDSVHYDQVWQTTYINNFVKNINDLRNQKDKIISIENIIENTYNLFDITKFIKDNWEESKCDERFDSLLTLKEFAKGNNIKSFLKFVNSDKKYSHDKDGIKLMTIHGSKGLEFKHVFVISIENGKFPHEKSDLLEEARLFYVAITRPTDCLYISQIYDDNQFVNEYFNKT